MSIGRRAILFGGAASFIIANEPATGCSLTAMRRPEPFNDQACRQQLKDVVKMLNDGPSLKQADIQAWLDDRQINIDSDLLWHGDKQLSEAEFFQSYRWSEGKLDTNPIRLKEVSLVQRRKNKAAYAFTLQRYSYNAADWEGCNGLFTHPEFWREQAAGYIASFEDNIVRSLRNFPE